MASTSHSKLVRYAVIGLGHIAQVAVLPAFKHARRNSRLVALVSEVFVTVAEFKAPLTSPPSSWL